MPSKIAIEIRNSARVLKEQGRSLHEISRLLKLSLNTVRRILRERDAPPARGAAAAGQARGCLHARRRQRRARAATAGRREQSANSLQHFDALDQRGGGAPPPAARRRKSLQPPPGGAPANIPPPPAGRCSTTPRRPAG